RASCPRAAAAVRRAFYGATPRRSIRMPERRAGSGLPHRLEVAELADARGAQFAADAGVLDAPEWELRVRDGHAVDEDGTGVDVLDEELLVRGVRRPHGRAEAEGCLVGDAQRFLAALDAVQRRDRPERLLEHETHPVAEVRDDGRGVEPAVTFWHGPAGEHGGTLRYGVVDEFCELIAARLRCERADIRCRVHGVPDDEGAEALGEGTREVLVDIGVHDEALARDA